MSPIETPLASLRTQDSTSFVRALETGDDALLARVHTIRAAKQSIEIQTFIWANDQTGRYMFWELLCAARRGVKVRLLVDQWVAALSETMTPELMAFVATAHPNLQAKVYNPKLSFEANELEVAGSALLDFKGLNQRMHNKIVVVDGWLGVTGGRNIENDYYDRGERRNFRDRDALLIGPAVSTMQQSFETYWSYDRSLPLGSLRDVRERIASETVSDLGARDRLELGDQFDALDEAASDPQHVGKVLIDPGSRVRNARFVADEPGKNPSIGLTGGGRSSDALRELIVSVEERLVLQSPYFVLDDAMDATLEELVKSREHLQILVSTNSLASTDNLTSYAIACKQRQHAIEDLGLRLFELNPAPRSMNELLPRYPELQHRLDDKLARGEPLHPLDDNEFENDGIHLALHAKTYVVDQRVVWIGSFNLDPRSKNLNTEVGLVVDDPHFASLVEDSILQDIAPGNSWVVAPRRGLEPSADAVGSLESALDRVRDEGLGALAFSECFELKPGMEPVSCFHPDFYQRYEALGPYPSVSKPVEHLQMTLLQTLASLATPLL